MKEYMINGIPVCLEKKKIKNMYIRVLPPEGTVCVTVPRQTSRENIIKFVISREAWIRKAQERMKARALPAVLEYKTGEVHWFFGEALYLEVRYADKRSVKRCGDRLILTVHQNDSQKAREKTLNQWYRGKLKEQLFTITGACEKRVGISGKEYRIKNMKTRWGSCNVTDRRIWLNLKLAEKPLECLEYVVIHELVHLLEPSHNPVFWRYVEEFCPDFRRREQRLNSREAQVQTQDAQK